MDVLSYFQKKTNPNFPNSKQFRPPTPKRHPLDHEKSLPDSSPLPKKRKVLDIDAIDTPDPIPVLNRKYPTYEVAPIGPTDLERSINVQKNLLNRKIGRRNASNWLNQAPFYTNTTHTKYENVLNINMVDETDVNRPKHTPSIRAFHNSDLFLINTNTNAHSIINIPGSTIIKINKGVDKTGQPDISADDRKYLLSNDSIIRIFDTETNRSLSETSALGSNFSKFYPFNNNLVFSGSQQSSVKLFDLRTNICETKKAVNLHTIDELNFLDSNQFLTSSRSDGMLRMWDIRYIKSSFDINGFSSSRNQLGDMKSKSRGIVGCKIDPSTGYIYSLGADSNLSVYSANYNSPIIQMTLPFIEIQPYGTNIEISSRDNISTLEINSRNTIYELKIPRTLSGMGLMKHTIATEKYTSHTIQLDTIHHFATSSSGSIKAFSGISENMPWVSFKRSIST